jgi:beta-lactam-binding protein with PASTA domain
MSVDAATDALRWTELAIVQLPTITSSDPVGVVLRQQPEAGTPVTRTKAETLFVATAPKKPRPERSSVWDAPSKPAGDSSGHGEVYQNVTCLEDLTGRTPMMVAASLRRAGLRPGRIIRDYSDEIDSGRVFRQHPLPACNIVTGTPVTLWYSNGPHPKPGTLTVPSVIGLTLREAADSLLRVNLRPGHVDSVINRGGEGKVLRQLPHEGESAHPGDVIDLIVTIAPARVEVPSLIGMSRGKAEESLESAGLNIGRITLVTVDTEKIGIISQKPLPETLVDSASLVDIVENQRAEVRYAEVPNLVGKSLTQSDSILKLAGLVVGQVVRLGPDRPDEVTDQKPTPGTRVLLGAQVSVALGVPVRVVTQIVPDVVNLSVDSARRILNDSGFTQISVAGAGDPVTSQSLIESQVPAGGTPASAQTLVSLTARTPPPRRLVPNLVGQSRKAARGIAQLDSLQLIVTSEIRRLRLRDRVVSQHPIAWASRPADNTIDVVTEIPIIPPFLVIGVLGFGAVAGTLWRFVIHPTPIPPPDAVIPPRPPEVPTPEVSMVALTQPAGPPLLDTGGRSNLIDAEYRLLFDLTTDPVTTETENDTIVKSAEVRNV